MLALNDKARLEDEYGLDLKGLTAELAESLSFALNRAVMILGTRKRSQADKDGLEAGDIITAIAAMTGWRISGGLFNNQVRLFER